MAAVVDAAQERGQLGLGEAGGGVAGRVAAQEGDRHLRVQVGKQPDRAGKAPLQLGGELVAQRHAGLRPARRCAGG
jgi:hypothetical protein